MSKLNGRYIISYLGLLLLAVFYILAGLNHFREPEFYYPLIPPYLPYHGLINITAGVFEIGLGFGLLFQFSRKLSAIMIILMLIAFIPAHIYFIQIGGCADVGLCVPEWVAWIRLVLIHPLLIMWVWRYRHSDIDLRHLAPA